MQCDKDERLVIDGIDAGLSFLLGGVVGSCAAFTNPHYIPRKIKSISRTKIESFGEFAYSFGAFASYVAIFSNALEGIVKKPSDPTSYIMPAVLIASNAISFSKQKEWKYLPLTGFKSDVTRPIAAEIYKKLS